MCATEIAESYTSSWDCRNVVLFITNVYKGRKKCNRNIVVVILINLRSCMKYLRNENQELGKQIINEYLSMYNKELCKVNLLLTFLN